MREVRPYYTYIASFIWLYAVAYKTNAATACNIHNFHRWMVMPWNYEVR